MRPEPGTKTFRLLLEEQRLGRLHRDPHTRLWVYGGHMGPDPVELLRGRFTLSERAHQALTLAEVAGMDVDAKLRNEGRQAYPHAYYIGEEPPEVERFTPVRNDKERVQTMLNRGLTPIGVKPYGGLWLSPWARYAPEWAEWMLCEGYREEKWESYGVWELRLDGLEILDYDPNDPMPDFEAMAERYDVFHLTRRALEGWAYGWDVETYLLLRWPEGARWLKIAHRLSDLLPLHFDAYGRCS